MTFISPLIIHLDILQLNMLLFSLKCPKMFTYILEKTRLLKSQTDTLNLFICIDKKNQRIKP